MKKYIAFLALFTTGCTITPLPSGAMQADAATYNQLESDFYLKHKIAVAPVKSELPPKLLNHDYYDELYANATLALADSLDKAGMLVHEAPPSYTLQATLIDVENPHCFFGTCETGSTIKYELKHHDEVVYQDMLVVPQNYEYPIFGANMALVIRNTLGTALGNNFAHLIHVLANKNKEDLK